MRWCNRTAATGSRITGATLKACPLAVNMPAGCLITYIQRQQRKGQTRSIEVQVR